LKHLRNAFVWMAAFLWASALWAATTSTTTTAGFTLEQGSTVLQRDLATLAACEAAGRARSEATRTSRAYYCRQASRVDVAYTADAPPPPPPPASGAPTLTVQPGTYAVGGYATIIWGRCTAPAVKSSTPAYAVWDSTPGADGGRSVAPNVTTTFTLACANGTTSSTLTVTGAPPPVDPPPTGGGGGNPPPPPPTNLPVPTVLPQPIALPVRQLPASDPLHNFAQTALRNWSHGGHQVPVPFDRGQGFWSPETCTQDYAAWLFDRPTAWFKYAELTGDARFVQTAAAELRFYAQHINASGIFDCKTGEADTKYLNVRPFVLYERATGDQSLRPAAARLYAQSAQGFDAAPPSGGGLWTEREVGIHGDAALAYYELTGNTQALARAASLVRHWSDMAGTVGAPQVTYTQHEGGGPGGTQPTNLTNSPWMSAIYFQFARNYWQITGDETVLRQASAYFDWLTVNGLYDGRLFHPEFSGVTVPRYLTGEQIGDAGYDEGNINHCPAVQGFVAFAVDAKRRLSLPTAAAEQRLTELQACTARTWANWTRTATQFPRYRIQNPRFWNLWSAGLYEAAR
jgi:hypothetical protein